MIIQRNINLFIIEDNLLYLTAIEQFLITEFRKSGHRVSIQAFQNAENCLEYLNCYNSKKPDIIVLDYFLNAHFSRAMNGLNALFQFKLYNPEVEVIFLSSQKDMEVTVESLRTGAFDYISKDDDAFKKVFNSILVCIDDIEKPANVKAGYN